MRLWLVLGCGNAYGAELGPRSWGGGDTPPPAFKQLPVLQAGDWDLMRPLFDMYSRMLPLARARTHEYFNHSGAYFPEITNVYGMFANGGWGYGCAQNRRPQWPPHQIENVHTRYEFQGGLELVWMMLDFFHFTQSEAFLQVFCSCQGRLDER